jgi:inosine-uridine nucleoside N-ribohydrolase
MDGRQILATLSSCALLSLAGCAGPTTEALQPAPPHPVARDGQPTIIDTDMAADDWLAILYLLEHPDVDVKAITVAGTGEAHCPAGTRNALDLAALAGRPEIPVACGRETPLAGNHTFPREWRERVDSLMGLSLPENPNDPTGESAAELLSRIVRESPQQVDVVALGPLTNVAEALEGDPALADNLRMITVMGGAIGVAGNIASSSSIENTVAEWNIYVDPHAAAVVFGSEAAVTLVPLDATNHAPVTMDFYRRLERDRCTPVAEFAYRVLTESEGFIRSGGYYFWDPLAAAIATDEGLGTFQEVWLTVTEEEGPDSGHTLVGDDGDTARAAMTADRARFETLFLDALNGRLP